MSLKGKDIKEFHAGSMIESWLKDNNITKTRFAELMELPWTNAYRLLSNHNIDLSKFLEVCIKLNHNFIADICEKPHFAGFVKFGETQIGQTISDRLKILKMSQSEFAQLMGMFRSDVSKLLKKNSIGTDRLTQICQVLDHNFYQDLLPVDFSDPDFLKDTSNDVAALAYELAKKELEKDKEGYMAEISKLRIENQKLISKVKKLQNKNTELGKMLKEVGADVKS